MILQKNHGNPDVVFMVYSQKASVADIDNAIVNAENATRLIAEMIGRELLMFLYICIHNLVNLII